MVAVHLKKLNPQTQEGLRASIDHLALTEVSETLAYFLIGNMNIDDIETEAASKLLPSIKAKNDN